VRGAKGCVQVAGYLYIHVCECNVGVFSSVPQQERKKEKKLKLHVCINKYIPVPRSTGTCVHRYDLSLYLYTFTGIPLLGLVCIPDTDTVLQVPGYCTAWILCLSLVEQPTR